MSVQVENLEKNMAKLTIEVPAEELEKALEKAYQKQKSRISLPGFRKGKAPRKMIESMYGKGVFMEDAVNSLVPQEYSKAIADCDLEIVSQPEINVTQMEPGKALIFTADVATKPEVTLGDYKGVEVPKTEIAVTDEEVDAEVKKEQDKNSRTVVVEDRAAANGDITTIDFEGFVDGEAFEGGKGTDYPLTLGSGSFIPGFEDQLVGAKAGDHVEVKVTFPEEYQAKELAGKEAVFQCDVKKVEAKELPELDDDFAQDASEFDTLAEYKEDIKKNLTEKKEKEARAAKENAAVDKAIENAQMEIPDAMLNTQVRQMLDDFSRRMQSQGLTMEQYFQFTGMTLEKMQEEMKPQALKRIQTRLVLEKIAEVENIQPTDEEVEEEFKKMADAYKMEVEKIKELLGDRELEQMKKDMVTEIAATLAFSAIQNNDKIGVIFFSDRIEKFIPPKKGRKHILYIIRELLDFHPESRRTNIRLGLEYLTNVMKRRCTAFVLSDFIDQESFKNAMTIANRKHDVVAIQVYDRRVEELPAVGLMKIKDAETGHEQWIDTSSRAVRRAHHDWWVNKQVELNDTFTKSNVDNVSVRTDQDYVKALMNLFAKRN